MPRAEGQRQAQPTVQSYDHAAEEAKVEHEAAGDGGVDEGPDGRQEARARREEWQYCKAQDEKMMQLITVRR